MNTEYREVGRLTVSLSKKTAISELRAINATMVRCLKIDLRYPLNFVLGQILWVGDLASFILLGSAFRSMSGVAEYTGISDFVSFFVIGQATWIFWRIVIDGMGNSLRSEQLWGTLETTYGCPFRRVSLLIGYLLSYIVESTVHMISVLTISALLFGLRFNTTFINVGIALVAFLLTTLATCGFGFIIAGLVFWLKEPGILFTFFMHPLWFFSGPFYTVQAIPSSIRWISYLIPTSYSIDLIRTLLIRSNPVMSIVNELLALLIFAVLLPAFGFLIFLKLEKESLKKGSFATY